MKLWEIILTEVFIALCVTAFTVVVLVLTGNIH
jgi:hypothetical protein